MTLPTIESSYVTHTTKSIQGFNHPEYPVLRIALEVLNATEGYLWVCCYFAIDCKFYANYTSVIYGGQGWRMVPLSPWTSRLGFSVSLYTA